MTPKTGNLLQIALTLIAEESGIDDNRDVMSEKLRLGTMAGLPVLCQPSHHCNTCMHSAHSHFLLFCATTAACAAARPGKGGGNGGATALTTTGRRWHGDKNNGNGNNARWQ